MKGTKNKILKLAVLTAGTLHVINKIIDSNAITKMTFKAGGKNLSLETGGYLLQSKR